MPAVSRILPWLLLSALVDGNCYSRLPTSQQSTQITTAMPRWNACRRHAVPYRSNILPSRHRQCTQPKQGLRHEPHAHGRPPLLRRWPRRGLYAIGLLRKLEELRARIEHQHIVLLALERGPVGLEPPVEPVEIRVLPVCLGIDRRGPGISFALDLLRLAVGVGENHLALPIGVRTDLLGFRCPQRSQFVGDSLALGLHALVDPREHLVG